MFHSLSKKLSVSFVSVSIISMLSMIILTGYGGAKILMDKTTTDTETFARQISVSMRDFDVKDTEKVQKYLADLVDKNGTITRVDLNSNNNTVSFSSDTSAVGKASPSYVQEAFSTHKVTDDFSGSGLEVAVPIEVDGNIIGCISVANNMDNIGGTLVKTVKRIGLFAILLLVLINGGAIFLSRRITRPIKKTVAVLNRISEGDFTATMKVETKDELGMLAEAMNRTLEILRTIIGHIKAATLQLDEVSHTLSDSSGEVADSSMDIAKTVEGVADGAQEQNEHLDKTVKLLEAFGRTIDSISQNVEKVSEASNNIKSSADSGSVKIEYLVKSVDDIRQAFEYVVDKLRALNVSVDKITEITTVINNVAGQTNLLALNASIEAARAGELGRGFAVVAEEIRVLAEQVSTSSKSIMTLVDNVTTETKEVSTTAETVNNKMGSQVETVENTVLSFKDILNQVLLIIPQIKNVNVALETAVSSKEDVIVKVESVASVAKVFSDSSQQISASTEEQTAAAEEVTATAQSLADTSSKLRQSIEKFII